jgi:galactokinase
VAPAVFGSARDRAVREYVRRFGDSPRWLSAAPGRVNLIGEHTDYNDGLVLPMAIEAQTVVAAGPIDGRSAVLESASFPGDVTLDLSRPLVAGPRHWSSYVAGVLAGAQRLGVALPGFRGVIESDVPPGAGLASSAALEVAVAGLVERIAGVLWDPREKARLCQRAEHEFAGVPSGLMDQLVAIFARADHALAIDCRSLAIDAVPIRDPEVVILIGNTNVRHALGDGAYAQRRAECAEAARRLGVATLADASIERVAAARDALGERLVARARHVVTEIGRVRAAVAAARARRWPDMGALMFESHRSLRDDFVVSCRELDVLVEAAGAIGAAGGVYGCRMTGGGFGGSVVCLVRRDAADDIGRAMVAAYRAETGRTATVSCSRPGPGARTEDL